jgi:UDP-2-acetamido-2-deoxy-ribo-hexuluronate aminotransferase
MDLLLCTDVIIDVCQPRSAHAPVVLKSISKCRHAGGRVWLYVGSVQTMVNTLARGLIDAAKDDGNLLSRPEALRRARNQLQRFALDKHWLASLANEGDVFDAESPENEQLIRALERFQTGAVKVLTRDKVFLKTHSEQTVSPEQYCRMPAENRRLDFIDLKSQQDLIRPQLENNIHRALHHGRYIMGTEISELEEKLAEYVGVKNCITCGSGTDSLLIAMMALGIGPGDEVITTPFTFIATGEMIALLGAKPVFVDIDPHVYNIAPSRIEAAITANTKAIMPVSLYGQCADMDAINDIADEHGLTVIEDGAQSFGASYKGRRSCGLSTIGSTSFFPSKPMGCYGDGGALFTNDDALAKLMREIRVHGQDRRYHHPRIGISSRLDTLQAAILLSKLERLDEEIEQRQKVASSYTKLITENCPQIVTPHIEAFNVSVYAQYTIQVTDRTRAAKRLSDAGIPTAVHYPMPLHLQPAFGTYGGEEDDFPAAEEASKRVISLPMHPHLAVRDQQRVIDMLCCAGSIENG